LAEVDRRARDLVAQMTLDEKIGLVHSGFGMPFPGVEMPEGSAGGAGFNPGVPRLGVPPMQETDASLGVANPFFVRGEDDEVTALPCSLLWAATFDAALAREAGGVAGAEARWKGFNVLLGGGANLCREPRCGRNFEYVSEDPLLTGLAAGAAIVGAQAAGVVCTLKHLALNAQETGRVVVSSEISEEAARESDLLAFEIAVQEGRPWSVMTAYNRYRGLHCEENPWLVSRVLKGDWGFEGFVMSDWGSTHSTVEAALAGLDRQSGEQIDPEVYFGEPLRAAVEDGRVPVERLDDMVARIVAALLAVAEVEAPAVDLDAHGDLAQRVAEQGIVLLRNEGGVLPLQPSLRRVAVLGGRADGFVLAGGGSSLVRPPGTVTEVMPGIPDWAPRGWHPSSPLEALRAAMPDTEFVWEGDPASTDAAIVFATQWMTEVADAPDLSLPDGQDELIASVAAANPRTVVVLETGGPVLMPWLSEVAAVVEAWYPGGRGGEAIAAVLTGAAPAAGRLPMTFPRGVEQLPRPRLSGPPGAAADPAAPRGSQPAFSEDYDIEGSDVGYRWFEREGHEPLFPFGFGLSYTTFEYANLTVDGLTASVDVTNTGDRAVIETPQFYVAGEYPARLAGFNRVALEPGQTARVTVHLDPRTIASFRDGHWSVGGAYSVSAGPNARERPLSAPLELPETSWPPNEKSPLL
jgi:beta-glucosidase